MDVLLKDKMAFCNSLEIDFSAYRLLWVNKKVLLLSKKTFSVGFYLDSLLSLW